MEEPHHSEDFCQPSIPASRGAGREETIPNYSGLVLGSFVSFPAGLGALHFMQLAANHTQAAPQNRNDSSDGNNEVKCEDVSENTSGLELQPTKPDCES